MSTDITVMKYSYNIVSISGYKGINWQTTAAEKASFEQPTVEALNVKEDFNDLKDFIEGVFEATISSDDLAIGKASVLNFKVIAIPQNQNQISSNNLQNAELTLTLKHLEATPERRLSTTRLDSLSFNVELPYTVFLNDDDTYNANFFQDLETSVQGASAIGIPGQPIKSTAHVLNLFDYLFLKRYIEADIVVPTIFKLTPALTTSFGLFFPRGNANFDDLLAKSNQTENQQFKIFSLIQKVLIHLLSDSASNKFRTSMGTGLMRILGQQYSETELLQEITTAVTNVEQEILIEQIGESNLSQEERLQSLTIESLSIVQDTATLVLRLKNTAGTIISYPLNL